METAQAFMTPLLNVKSPLLVGCNIRLSQYKQDGSLAELAREAALCTMGKDPDPQQVLFPFLDLPKELRLLVLEFTGLVTPCQEITWEPTGGFYLHYDIDFCRGASCPPESHRTCRFQICYTTLGNGCFCTRYHTAFAPAICTCWQPPTSLFLVCKFIRQEAQSVFFAANRFIIMPIGGYACAPDNLSAGRLEASIFLRDVVPSEMLYYLKFLRLFFLLQIQTTSLLTLLSTMIGCKQWTILKKVT